MINFLNSQEVSEGAIAALVTAILAAITPIIYKLIKFLYEQSSLTKKLLDIVVQELEKKDKKKP